MKGYGYYDVIETLKELGLKKQADVKEEGFEFELWSKKVGRTFITIIVRYGEGVVDIHDLYNNIFWDGIPYEHFLKNLNRYKSIKTLKALNS